MIGSKWQNYSNVFCCGPIKNVFWNCTKWCPWGIMIMWMLHYVRLIKWWWNHIITGAIFLCCKHRIVLYCFLKLTKWRKKTILISWNEIMFSICKIKMYLMLFTLKLLLLVFQRCCHDKCKKYRCVHLLKNVYPYYSPFLIFPHLQALAKAFTKREKWKKKKEKRKSKWKDFYPQNSFKPHFYKELKQNQS